MAARWVVTALLVGWASGLAAAGDGIVYKTPAGKVARYTTAVEERLDRVIEWDVEDAPLSEALDRVEELTKLEIILDNAGLHEEGIDAETPVTFRMQRASARKALQVVLEPLALTAVNEDGVLKVTTQKAANHKTVTAFYPVEDLAESGYLEEDMAGLRALLGEFAPDGVSQRIIPFGRPARMLAIVQSRAAHDKSREALSALRVSAGLPPVPATVIVDERDFEDRREPTDGAARPDASAPQAGVE